MSEEDVVLEAVLKQIALLFQEIAAYLEKFHHENQRIQSRHLNTVIDLETEVIQAKETLVNMVDEFKIRNHRAQ